MSMQFKNRLRVSEELNRGSHGSAASHREPTRASIRYYYNHYYYYYKYSFLFCFAFFVLRVCDRPQEKTAQED